MLFEPQKVLVTDPARKEMVLLEALKADQF